MVFHLFSQYIDITVAIDLTNIHLKLQSVRASLIRAAVAKMARVLWWRLIDVINVEIATVTHLNVHGPNAAVAGVGEACLPCYFTFVHCGMSTI